MTTNSVSRLYQSSSWRSHSFSQLKSPHWTGDYSSVLMCLASIHQVMGSMLEHIHTHKHTHSMLMKAKDSILIVKKRIRKRLYYIKYHKKHCFPDLFKILKIIIISQISIAYSYNPFTIQELVHLFISSKFGCTFWTITSWATMMNKTDMVHMFMRSMV